jgi:hypothetical protein
MKFSMIPKVLGHGLLGSIGLGLVLGGITPSAQAGSVAAGFDYLVTPFHPPGSTYSFNVPGVGSISVDFKGLPVGTPNGSAGGYSALPLPNGAIIPGTQGLADTVVLRENAIPDTSAPGTLNSIKSFLASPGTCSSDPSTCVSVYQTGGQTDIEITELSLKSIQPVVIPTGLPIAIDPGTYDVYVGLQKYYGGSGGGGIASSKGQMFIGDDGIDKTWDSRFTIKAMAFLLPVGTNSSGNDFVKGVLQGITSPLVENIPYACTNVGSLPLVKGCYGFTVNDFIATNEPWNASPQYGDLVGQLSPDPGDFFLGRPGKHQAPTHFHTVRTPGPLPILGASTAYAFSRRLRKRCREVVKLS